MTPHALCYFVVIDWAKNFSQERRYVSVAESSGGSFNVRDEEEFREFHEIHINFRCEPIEEVPHSVVGLDLGDDAPRPVILYLRDVAFWCVCTAWDRQFRIVALERLSRLL